MRKILLLTIWLSLATGCGVHRTLTVKSYPEGALVYLNGLEVGRTPVQHDFVWYGTYDVELRKDGYQTLKTRGKVFAPWWQWVPIDLFAELVPFHLHDQQKLSYRLDPMPQTAADADLMIRHAGEMQAQMESSERTRRPSTMQATARPATRKSRTTRPAATQSTTVPTAPPPRIGF
jgi:hypothetical protein